MRFYLVQYIIVLRKINSCSCKKAARKFFEKMAVGKAWSYIVSIVKKTFVYKLEYVKLAFWNESFSISLTCVCIQAYSVGLYNAVLYSASPL